MEFYKHSGRVPLAGLCWALIAGCLVAVPLGVVYSYGTNWIPIVYVNFLLTLVLGAAIGGAVGLGASAGRIRNVPVASLAGAAMGLVGLYVAWAADPIARFGQEEAMMQLGIAWLFDPRVLWAYMQIFYENGFWGMSDGNPVSGIFLGIVWLVEAGIILFVAAKIPATMLADKPYCETCNQWATIESDVQRLVATPEQQGALNRLLTGDLQSLSQLDRTPGDGGPYIRLDLATCGLCSDTNFLSVQAVTPTVDNNGNPTTAVQPLLKHLVIREEDIELVRQAGREPTPMPVTEELAEKSADLIMPDDAKVQQS